MENFEIIMIAVGLAMDAFAVSIGAGTTGYLKGPRPALRLSFHFGLFQFFMPVLGWFLGFSVAHFIAPVDHWIAFGLLCFVGGRMIKSAFDPDKKKLMKDPSRGITLVILSFATSIDAFVIGLSLAMLNVAIWYPSVLIGIVTATLSLFGIWFGNKLSNIVENRIEIVGGVILIIIGFRILITHLF